MTITTRRYKVWRVFYKNKAKIAFYDMEKLTDGRTRANIYLEGKNLDNDSQSLGIYSDDHKKHTMQFIRGVMAELFGTELGEAILDSLMADFGGSWRTQAEIVVFT